MSKNSSEVFRRDADAVIADRDRHLTVARPANMDFEPFFYGSLFIHCVFGVAQEIHQDLQDLMTIDHDAGDFLVDLLDDSDAMAFERRSVHSHGILHERSRGDGLQDAKDFRVALLHSNDFLDVLDELHHADHFGKQFIPLRDQQSGSFGQVFRNQLALWIIGQEPRQLTVLTLQHGRRPAEVLNL